MRQAQQGKPKDRAEFVSTREGYDRWSSIYDEEQNPLIALETPLVDLHMGDVRDLDVVDLGCGTGRHAVRLAQAGARVTAVDFSDGMLDAARRKPGWAEVQFMVHDLTKPLPLADKSFDRVLSCLVVEHIPNLAGFFAECRRICRPDGFVLITNMHPGMLLAGVQAHFTDPTTGKDVCPEGCTHQLSDFVMAALEAGLQFEAFSEHFGDERLAGEAPRARRFIGWPMLFVMRLRP